MQRMCNLTYCPAENKNVGILNPKKKKRNILYSWPKLRPKKEETNCPKTRFLSLNWCKNGKKWAKF